MADKKKQSNIVKPSSFTILKPLKKFWKRFQLTFFFVFVVACLSGAVLLINQTIKDPSLDPNYTSSINAGSIDQETLDHLNALHTSNQPTSPPAASSGRINPFGE